ncbi:hypothetical protein BDZ94DRAFT_1248529, partial [Collybia nuda]
MAGCPPWLEDAAPTRPPRYIEQRFSRPYVSSLLRTECIAQRIPAPPAPTCVNKAVKPSFEYAEKSPARPAFPIRRQTCSLQPTRIFVGSTMTFIHPPSSANILKFPESTQPATTPRPSGSLFAPMVVALIDLAGPLAMLFSILWALTGLVVMGTFKVRLVYLF